MKNIICGLRIAALSMLATAGVLAHAQTAPAKPAKPAGAALLSLESGRANRDLVITTGVRGYKRPASNQIHALILAAGDYKAPGITPLRGVPHDIKTATEIATRLGVSEKNIQVIKDADLTLEGIRQAFKKLDENVKPGDDVFVYYSGHGARQLIKEESGERCAESLVTIDGFAFNDAELSDNLSRLAQTAKKIIVFFDACHSGGVSTRSAKFGEFVPKTASLPGQGKACDIPSNIVKRSIAAKSATRGAGGANYVYIAAARDDEVAFDSPSTGGVASQAWISCLRGDAADLDRSGGLSAKELVTCAQAKVNAKVANQGGIKPHNITITGNAEMVLSYLDTTPAAPPDQAATPSAPGNPASPPAAVAAVAAQTASMAPTPPSTTTAAANRPQPTPPPVVAAEPAKIAPLATLNDMFQGRDDRRLVRLSSPTATLKINQDRFNFSVYSREEGYVYILMAGSDGTTFDILFPNQIDGNHKIRAGETLTLPRASWRLTAGGPVGKNTVLAIVSDGPRDFSNLKITQSGPFSVVSVSPVTAKDIQLVTLSSAVAESSDCSQPLKRNLVIAKECSNSYGADRLEIEEIK